MRGSVRTPTTSEALHVHGDVQVRIWLGDRVLDFRATPTAALTFCCEWRRKRAEAIEILDRSTHDRMFLPRLPCEQLFQQPGRNARHGRE